MLHECHLAAQRECHPSLCHRGKKNDSQLMPVTARSRGDSALSGVSGPVRNGEPGTALKLPVSGLKANTATASGPGNRCVVTTALPVGSTTIAVHMVPISNGEPGKGVGRPSNDPRR